MEIYILFKKNSTVIFFINKAKVFFVLTKQNTAKSTEKMAYVHIDLCKNTLEIYNYKYLGFSFCNTSEYFE